MVALVKIFTQSAADFLDEWFESAEVKVTLATDGVIGANGGPRSPGTAYILLHHCMGGVAGHRGLWGFVRGGMGAVSEAIAASARAARRRDPHRTPRWRKSWCAAAAHAAWCSKAARRSKPPPWPPTSIPRSRSCGCSTSASCRPGFRRRHPALPHRRHKLQNQPGALRPAGFHAPCPGAPGPQHRATMHICPTIEYVERAWDDAKYGRPSERPLLELTIPTMYDPSLAPPGKHIMGIFLQYAPYTLREGHVGRTARAVRRPRDRR